MMYGRDVKIGNESIRGQVGNLETKSERRG